MWPEPGFREAWLQGHLFSAGRPSSERDSSALGCKGSLIRRNWRRCLESQVDRDRMAFEGRMDLKK